MTNKEVEKIDSMIHRLDEAVGRLLVASMNDLTVREAMTLVSQVSFELGNML